MVQITFENPFFLWLIFALPLFWLTHFYWLRHTKRKAMKFANFKVLKRITGHTLITRNYTILALRSVIIFFAILAASQTVIWYEGDVQDNAFVIAIDTSASMRAEDVSPSRIGAAKEYAQLFVESVDENAQFALVSFSGVTFIEETLTSEKNKIQSAIEDITTIDAGGTDIPGALITSTNLLATVEGGRVIILITDGSNTLETFTSDSVQRGVDYVQEHHVVVHAIGLGSQSAPIGYLPSYYNISAVYDEDNLLRIANATGGSFYAASDREALTKAYESITENSHRAMVNIDLAPGLMLLILMLLFLEWGLISTRFRSIP